MKSIIKYISAIILTGVLFVSCKKDGDIITAKEGVGGSLSSSVSTLVLSKTTAADSVIKFSWSLSDFGYDAALTQTLQIAYSNTGFADSITIALDPKQISESFTGQDFNSLIGKLNLPFNQVTSIYVRIKATISNSFDPAYSNTVTIAVTPYAMTSWIYVPGAYQNWTPATADSLVSITGNGIYTGIISFPDSASEFKITPAKNWDASYGAGSGGTLSTSGGNLKSPGKGSYKITANMNSLTYSMEYFQWSIIGDATPGGWSTDSDMKYNNGDSTWSVTATLSAGSLKFRKNHDWGTNYGGSGGTLASGGDNIPVTAAGKYLILLDIPNNKYTLTKQ